MRGKRAEEIRARGEKGEASDGERWKGLSARGTGRGDVRMRWEEDGRTKWVRTRDLDTVDRTVSGHLEEGEVLGIQRVEEAVDGGAVDSG